MIISEFMGYICGYLIDGCIISLCSGDDSFCYGDNIPVTNLVLILCGPEYTITTISTMLSPLRIIGARIPLDTVPIYLSLNSLPVFIDIMVYAHYSVIIAFYIALVKLIVFILNIS